MRKIISQEEFEKRRKKRIKILGILLLLTMVFGTIGYGFVSYSNFGDNSRGANNELSNSFNFINYAGKTLYFTNSLEETKNISVEITKNINDYINSIVYVDSENNAIIEEIRRTLGNYVAKLQEACYGACERDLPEKDCSTNLIVWKDKIENRVYQQENCIFIEGDTRAVDAFLYKLFGY